MALFGSVNTLRGQLARPDHFAAAWRYLEQAFDPSSDVQARILATPPGETRRVELPGGAFALEQVYPARTRAEMRFEAHERHVDLQAVVRGREQIEVLDVARLQETENALAERDVRFFADAPGASLWRLEAGDVAVFFPADAHLPSVALGAGGLVYKTVVKVPVPSA